MYNSYLITKNNTHYEEGDYNYLLNMRISTLTKEKVEELRKENERIEVEIATLEGKEPSDLWLEDLTVFENSFQTHMKEYYKANELDPKEYTKKNRSNKIVIGLKK